jgi:hypothetical protein
MVDDTGSLSPGTRRLWKGFAVLIGVGLASWFVALSWLVRSVALLALSGPVGLVVVVSAATFMVALAADWVRSVVPAANVFVTRSLRPSFDALKRISSTGLSALKGVGLPTFRAPRPARLPDMATLVPVPEKAPVSACTPAAFSPARSSASVHPAT